MSSTDSRLSHADCYELMDQALRDPKGIRVKYPSHGDAWSFRLRLHNARRIDRKDNAKTYSDKEHPMHGRSVYDQLVIKLRTTSRDDFGMLELEKVTTRSFDVQSLADNTSFMVDTDAEPMVVPAASRLEEKPIPDLDFIVEKLNMTNQLKRRI